MIWTKNGEQVNFFHKIRIAEVFADCKIVYGVSRQLSWTRI